MLAFEKREYVTPLPKNFEAVLGADIGGTNSNFGIFSRTNGKLELVISLHAQSQDITNFTDVVKNLLEHLQQTYGITIKHSCFAAAGVVSEHRDRCKPTNLDFVIDTNDIVKNTPLECATLANDFEIIGHGLMLLDSDSLVQVKPGTPRKHAAHAILGAGTGLGKCILQWHETLKRAMPMPSEGGHADFGAQNELELALIQFIQETEERACNISWEDVLSGNGIKRIYEFFRSRNGNAETHKKLQKRWPSPRRNL